MISKKISFLILTTLCFVAEAQDSLKQKAVKPERPREIGISILSPLIILTGTSDNSGRFSNLTYRYRLTSKHSIKGLVGAALPYPIFPETFPNAVSTVSQSTIYSAIEKSNKFNIQVGAGYEYLRGGRLKHGPGLDLVYNYTQEKEDHYYLSGREEIDPEGNKTMRYDRIDTGSYTTKTDINKLGFNLSYSLRYEMSRKWLITCSMIGSYRFYQKKTKHGMTTVHDFNMFGVIADLSIFYRF